MNFAGRPYPSLRRLLVLSAHCGLEVRPQHLLVALYRVSQVWKLFIIKLDIGWVCVRLGDFVKINEWDVPFKHKIALSYNVSLPSAVNYPKFVRDHRKVVS